MPSCMSLPGEETLLLQSDDTERERLAILLSWANARHVWINDSVRIESRASLRPTEQDAVHADQHAHDKGFGIFVKDDATHLVERQVLILVPKNAILSPRSSSLMPHLSLECLYSSDAASGLYLSLTLLHEFLLGREGPWWGYLQSLPRSRNITEHVSPPGRSGGLRWGVSLPLHLDRKSAEWSWMQGTEASRIVCRAHEDPLGRNEGFGMSLPRLEAFFNSIALPILKKAHASLLKSSTETQVQALLSDFISMHSIISSRAFVVDMYHGQALVPLADMFNHTEDANVHFEADDDVCDECGALGSCPHSDDPLPASAYGRPSAFLPAAYGPNSSEWKTPEGLEGLDTVDLVAQETILPGQEAYNSYGCMSNATLLASYGFCLEAETEFDRCTWEWRSAAERDQLRHALGLERSRKRKVQDDEPGSEGRGNGIEEAEHTKEDGYGAWTEAFRTFTHLPAESLLELTQDPLQVLAKERKRNGAASDASASLTMPVNSPFVALARPVGSVFEEDGEQREALAPYNEAFVGLSVHDGSRDSQQPLFLDGLGRISWPLWRSALLATIVACEWKRRTASIEEIIEGAEIVLGRTIRDERVGGGRDDDEKFSRSLIRGALLRVKNLIEGRCSNLFIYNQPDGRSQALQVIENGQPGLLRSCVLHAFQELTALQACQDRLDSYLRSMDRSPSA